MTRKIISALLIIVLIFNFTFCNKSYAEGEGDEDSSKQEKSMVEDKVEYSGSTDEENINGTTGTTNQSAGISGIGMVVGLLARILNILIALQIDLLMATLSHNTITVEGEEEEEFWFSIDRAAFNRVSLFDINYFRTGPYTIGAIGSKEGTEISESAGNTAIKESVTKVYYVCRIIALILSLLVLIYIGIRMALSTVASDRARYKKMLIGWVESMVILFVMLYIISFVMFLGEKLTDIFYSMRNDLLEDGEEIFEDVIRDEVWSFAIEKSGFDLATWSIVYWCMLILQVKFFFNYARRFLMTGLLIIVSPLIIITYSIDKAGDGKAQAFDNWIKEFILCVLIQPLHALLYLIFAFTANAIASRSPLVALALMLAMTSAEKMVRVVFNINNSEIIKGTRFLKKGGK